MALWYNSRPAKEQNKFEPIHRMGLERHAAQDYRGYKYQFVRYRAGSTLPRTVIHASITDPHGNRVAYLTNFGSPKDAADAARKWIELAAHATRRAN